MKITAPLLIALFSCVTAYALEIGTTFCEKPDFKDSRGCVADGPAYCQDLSYKNAPACVGAHPAFCKDEVHKDAYACIGSKQGFCKSEANREALACLGSAPKFCSNIKHKNALACAGSKPKYCGTKEAGKAFACKPLVAAVMQVVLNGNVDPFANAAPFANGTTIDCTDHETQRRFRSICEAVIDPIKFERGEASKVSCKGDFEDGYHIGICQKVDLAAQKKMRTKY